MATRVLFLYISKISQGSDGKDWGVYLGTARLESAFVFAIESSLGGDE